jgi:ADP-ribose pyrophosphatase YjhB (NUDIX family)
VSQFELDLLAAMAGLVALLEAADERHWAGWFRADLHRLAAGDPSAIDHVLRAFGGMGSFNDLVLCPVNGHRVTDEAVPEVNRHLDSLGTRVYAAASILRSATVMPEVRIRVAIYVLRTTSRGPELLVFDHRDHPQAGTQIPAGGVEAGERLHEAAVREVTEETGVGPVTVRASLGVQQRPDRPRLTTFYYATTDEPRDRWFHVVDGEGVDEGLVFDCFFVPVTEALKRLPDEQAEFIPVLLGQLARER